MNLKYVTHSETSELAARRNEPNAGTQRALILRTLRRNPRGLTDHRQQEITGLDPSTQRPRRVELVEEGLVRDSGRIGYSPKGRKAVIWEAVPLSELDPEP